MDEPEGSHRTRSKAAPGWTVPESVILVNEISAVEAEWGANLPSFQKWQQIVENCNSLDVHRSLNQCKRQWEALLSRYRRFKHEAVEDFLFPTELFATIDSCVKATAKNGGGAEEAEEDEEEAAAEEEEEEEEKEKEEEQVAIETDLDFDPEAQGPATKFFFETGSKKRKRRMKRQNRRLETQNPWGYFTSTKIKHEEASDLNRNVGNTNTIIETASEEIAETKDQTLAKILQENALQIHTILERKLTDDNVDYKLADLKNAEAVMTDFTRRQGDHLIDCLGKISVTLSQLCDVVQQCN